MATVATIATTTATRHEAPRIRVQTAMSAGNHAGPNFWPGMEGNPWTCQRIAAASATSAAPVSASLTLMRRSLFGEPYGFERGSEVLVGLGHELRRAGGIGPDDAEAAARHEVLVL